MDSFKSGCPTILPIVNSQTQRISANLLVEFSAKLCTKRATRDKIQPSLGRGDHLLSQYREINEKGGTRSAALIGFSSNNSGLPIGASIIGSGGNDYAFRTTVPEIPTHQCGRNQHPLKPVLPRYLRRVLIVRSCFFLCALTLISDLLT